MRNKFKRTITALILGIALVGFGCSVSFAGISFNLKISPTSINFTDASPTTSPTITANSMVLISIQIGGASGTQAWSVHGIANGDLTSGSDTIPISSISWTAVQASGNCPAKSTCICDDGAMSATTPVDLINGIANTQGAPGYQCQATFTMINSWSYNPGSYGQSFVITATSP